ncbi:MAG: efflux RND transporter permease subunit [Alcanivoracaceae bacterium]|nr:efflux RND transporter permease subunit [Alcanivoracaceae bacterium]
MNITKLLVHQKRLILTTAILLALAGMNAWFDMKRQEDPFFPYRNGFVLTQYPGASVEDIENLVLKPLEQEISQVEEVSEIKGIARAGFSQITIRMKEYIYDTDTGWSHIRDAIERAKIKFPNGVLEPVLNDRVIDTPLVVYAITGSNDIMQMRGIAEEVKTKLLTIPELSKITFYAQPEEEIVIKPHNETLKNLGLNPEYIVRQITNKTELIPLRSLQSDSRQVLLNAQTEYQSVDEIKNTLITLPDGTNLPLTALADISYGVKQDATSVFWLDGQRAIGIGMFVPANQLNVVKFGERIRQKMLEIADDYPSVTIKPIFFQPNRVADRIAELGKSLLMGMLLVSMVLTFFLGIRPGLVVASIIPLVTFTALAVYNFTGNVLHQMAISGMVIALGMLVDNAIVMVENIQYHIDQGMRKSEASILAVKQLSFSLFSATGTTLAAFIPMLMAKGNTGDFTNAIPVVIMLSITISYIYSIFVTPAFSHLFLSSSQHSQQSKIMQMGEKFGKLATNNPKNVLLIALAFIVTSMLLFNFVKKDFFPSTDRNQIVVDITFAEGTNLRHNSAIARELSLEILKQPHVQHSYAFSGNSGPNFYYNLLEKPRSPNISRIDVELNDASHANALIKWIHDEVKPRYPNVDIIANKLGQGPPVTAPIEIKVFAQNRELLGDTVHQIQQIIEKTEGTRDVRNDLGVGLPSYQFKFKDEMLNHYQINRKQVAQSIGLATGGLVVGQYRRAKDPINIVIRDERGINFPLEQLENIELQLNGESIPLRELLDIKLAWLPAAVHHYDLQRTSSVFSEIQIHTTYASVLQDLQPVLEDLELAKGVTIQIAGTNKESQKANKSLGGAVPIGMILLLMFLLIEFNSFIKVAIILITIPLAFAGVPLGLLLTNTTFGFTAILGVLALIGIVVNNAIVMLDLIQKNLNESMEFNKAIIQAVKRRARPILLTTITTVAGLFPLVITKSTLWPPLAWTIISGLLVSTFMSLLVVPALYRLLLKNKECRLRITE